ncbi:HCLS1 binding protein 3 [Mactra antiquata]
MSRATVTVRELKNKETGIDLSVTSFKETKGMLGSTYEYQVVVVSNLSCFKSAKHKEADNVQFTVMKKLTDFENLHAKFNIKFSGTVFPMLPKKVLIMNGEVAKERRNTLDAFLRFLACTPKLCVDAVLLEFLGVSSVKAGQLQKMEVSESIVNKQEDANNDGDNDAEGTHNDDDDNNDDLFGDNDIQNDDVDDDDDLFGAEDVVPDKDVKLFEDQDFSGALEEGDGDDLFITGARSSVKVVSKDTTTSQEDYVDELLSDDDDLDKIMNMKITSKVEEDTEITDEGDGGVIVKDNDVNASEDNFVEQIKSVPATKPLKPALKAKPTVPVKKVNDNKQNADTHDDGDKASDKKKSDTKPKPPLKKKPVIAGKPDLKPKPSRKPKPPSDNVKTESDTDVMSKMVEQISTGDDILKYIQDNAGGDDDIDLFS